MSEGNEETPAGSWWGSWLDSAKAKTTTVFEAVKKDLDELSTAVRAEASSVGAALESTLKFEEGSSPVGTVKKSISSFFGQVSEALVPTLEDDEVEAVLITHDGAVTLTGFPRHLAEIQSNEKTYLEEPMEEFAGKYKLWLEVVEQDQFTQNQLSKHLASSEILNEKYLNLVPAKVPHMEFWKRYLFKRALLQDAIANAEIAEKRAQAEMDSLKTASPRKGIIQTEQPKLTCTEQDKPAIVSSDTEDAKNVEKDVIKDEINWESQDIPNNIELSEEEQIRLLQEYEQEIQEREKRKSVVLNEDASQKSDVETSNSNKEESKKPGQLVKQTPTKNTNNKQSPKQNDKEEEKSEPPTKKDNQLKVQKDHFNKEENASSTSDESWEKDFDLDE